MSDRLRLAALAAVLLLAGCARAAGPILFHPLPPDGREHYAMEKGALVFEVPAFSFTIRPLDWRVVPEEYRAASRPFPFGDDESAEAFAFFRVTIANRSEGRLVFNPLWTSALSQSHELYTPLEISDIFLFSSDMQETEGRARSFSETCFDGTQLIPPGNTAERFLVFPAPDSKTRALAVIVKDIYVGKESFDLAFSFEAFLVEEEKE